MDPRFDVFIRILITDYKRVIDRTLAPGTPNMGRHFSTFDLNQDGQVSFEEYAEMNSECKLLQILRIRYWKRKTGTVPVLFPENC